MMTRLYKTIDLKHGKLIKDIASGDLGILTTRFNVMEDWGEESAIWAWDIYWTGPSTDEENRVVPFIEQGIVGLLNGGIWLLVEE
jgi:hypothetical protein